MQEIGLLIHRYFYLLEYLKKILQAGVIDAYKVLY